MKLMHCPFCGSAKAESVLNSRSSTQKNPFRTHICCNDCGAQGPFTTGDAPYSSAEHATELWNGRLTLDADTSLRVAFKLTP